MRDKRKAAVKALNSKERGSKHHVFKFWTADVEFKKKKKKTRFSSLATTASWLQLVVGGSGTVEVGQLLTCSQVRIRFVFQSSKLYNWKNIHSLHKHSNWAYRRIRTLCFGPSTKWFEYVEIYSISNRTGCCSDRESDR